MPFFWGDNSTLNYIAQALSDIQRTQQTILNKLANVQAKEFAMALDVTALTDEVTRNTSVTQSVLALVQGLEAQIAAIPPSSDPTTQAALDQLKATLAANDDAIAAAVTANTPAAGT